MLEVLRCLWASIVIENTTTPERTAKAETVGVGRIGIVPLGDAGVSAIGREIIGTGRVVGVWIEVATRLGDDVPLPLAGRVTVLLAGVVDLRCRSFESVCRGQRTGVVGPRWRSPENDRRGGNDHEVNRFGRVAKRDLACVRLSDHGSA